jgi:hypothetical protein
MPLMLTRSCSSTRGRRRNCGSSAIWAIRNSSLDSSATALPSIGGSAGRRKGVEASLALYSAAVAGEGAVLPLPCTRSFRCLRRRGPRARARPRRRDCAPWMPRRSRSWRRGLTMSADTSGLPHLEPFEGSAAGTDLAQELALRRRCSVSCQRNDAVDATGVSVFAWGVTPDPEVREERAAGETVVYRAAGLLRALVRGWTTVASALEFRT